MVRKISNHQLDTMSPETSSQRILLEEYRLLQSRFMNLQDEGLTRMNFFITAASVSIGSVIIFGGSNSNLPVFYFKTILLVVLAILSILNYYICVFFTQRDILADRYERGLARIRHYFINLDSAIDNYFVTRFVEVPTSNIFKNNSGMRRAAQLIEGFQLGLAVTIFSTFTSLTPEIDILIGCMATVLIFLLFEINAQRKYRSAVINVKKDIIQFWEKENAKQRTIKSKAAHHGVFR